MKDYRYLHTTDKPINIAEFPDVDYIFSCVNHNSVCINGIWHRGTRNFDTTIGVVRVKTFSAKLRCFKKNRSCVNCGISGNVFLIQKATPRDLGAAWALQLYHISAMDATLMTRDHILSRANGGSNGDSNSQTLCYPCNQNKGIAEQQPPTWKMRQRSK